MPFWWRRDKTIHAGLNQPQTVISIVAILVEQTLWQNKKATWNDYAIDVSSIAEKITRYGQDIQNTLPLTRTVILPVKKDETSTAISKVLQKMYYGDFSGTGLENCENKEEKCELVGTVLIGEVPIPEVYDKLSVSGEAGSPTGKETGTGAYLDYSEFTCDELPCACIDVLQNPTECPKNGEKLFSGTSFAQGNLPLDNVYGAYADSVDNDGDCWSLPAKERDSNQDGKECFTGDNNVDEGIVHDPEPYLSMFPYTDFEDRGFNWSPVRNRWEANQDVSKPQAELWHGVIRPPVSYEKENEKYRQWLNLYFYQNHEYHTQGTVRGEKFDKEFLHIDPYSEAQAINKAKMGEYQTYLDHLGDIAHHRFSKHLFEILGQNSIDAVWGVQTEAEETKVDPNCGLTWKQGMSGTDQDLWDLAYGDGIWIAVGNAPMIRSQNGVLWEQVKLTDVPANEHITGIAYGNGIFIASTIRSGQILRSKDKGITWETVHTVTGSNNETKVAYGNGKFVVTRPDGLVLSSASGDPGTWQSIDLKTNIRALAYGNGKFMIGEAKGDKIENIYTSADGYNFEITNVKSAEIPRMDALVYGNGTWVSTGEKGGGYCFSNDDGATWTCKNDLLKDPAKFYAAVYAGGKFILAGDGNTAPMPVFISSDQSQSYIEAKTTARSMLLGLGAGGGKLIAIGARGGLSYSDCGQSEETENFGTSTSGLNYTQAFDTGLMRAVAHKDGRYAAASLTGDIFISNDGVTWENKGQPLKSAGFGQGITSIGFGSNNNILIGGGDGGETFYSTDGGITWKVPAIRMGTPVRGIAQANLASGKNVLVMVGGGRVYNNPNDLTLPTYINYILASDDDGLTWIKVDGWDSVNNIGFQPEGVTYGGNKFIVYGQDGRRATSEDGHIWQFLSRDFFTDQDFSFQGLISSSSQYMAVGGTTDRALSSQGKIVYQSPDLDNWESIPTIVSGDHGGYFQDLAYGEGQYVAVGEAGIYASTDLTNWKSVFSADYISKVIYDGTNFIAVGRNSDYYGIIVASPDGLHWGEKVSDDAETTDAPDLLGNIDNDNDGKIDEDPPGNMAMDGIDNDGDGLIDSQDPDFDGDADTSSDDDDGDGLIDEDPGNIFNIKDKMNQTSDIRGMKTIYGLLTNYFDVLSAAYHGNIMNMIESAGRWRTDNIDTMPKLLTSRDNFVRVLLKRANDVMLDVTTKYAHGQLKENLFSPSEKKYDVNPTSDSVSIPAAKDLLWLNNELQYGRQPMSAENCTLLRGTKPFDETKPNEIRTLVEANRTYNPLTVQDLSDITYCKNHPPVSTSCASVGQLCQKVTDEKNCLGYTGVCAKGYSCEKQSQIDIGKCEEDSACSSAGEVCTISVRAEKDWNCWQGQCKQNYYCKVDTSQGSQKLDTPAAQYGYCSASAVSEEALMTLGFNTYFACEPGKTIKGVGGNLTQEACCPKAAQGQVFDITGTYEIVCSKDQACQLRGLRFFDQDKFRVFADYADALNASESTLDSDFAFLKAKNIDGIRIFPNWWSVSGNSRKYSSSTLIDSSGNLREAGLEKLQTILEKAEEFGLVIDLSFMRETVENLSLENYQKGLVAVARKLSEWEYKNILLDLQNEHNDTSSPAKYLTRVEALNIRNAIKTVNSDLLVTASIGNSVAPSEAISMAKSEQLDFIAYHEPQDGDWVKRTASLCSELLTYNKPIYLQQPPTETLTDDFYVENLILAISSAKKIGAAAWTLHTNAGSSLSEKSWQSQLRPNEMLFLDSLSGEFASLGWGLGCSGGDYNLNYLLNSEKRDWQECRPRLVGAYGEQILMPKDELVSSVMSSGIESMGGSWQELDSTFVHNEPRTQTLSEQLASQAAPAALPIDNPYSVTWQSAAAVGIWNLLDVGNEGGGGNGGGGGNNGGGNLPPGGENYPPNPNASTINSSSRNSLSYLSSGKWPELSDIFGFNKAHAETGFGTKLIRNQEQGNLAEVMNTDFFDPQKARELDEWEEFWLKREMIDPNLINNAPSVADQADAVTAQTNTQAYQSNRDGYLKYFWQLAKLKTESDWAYLQENNPVMPSENMDNSNQYGLGWDSSERSFHFEGGSKYGESGISLAWNETTASDGAAHEFFVKELKSDGTEVKSTMASERDHFDTDIPAGDYTFRCFQLWAKTTQKYENDLLCGRAGYDRSIISTSIQENDYCNEIDIGEEIQSDRSKNSYIALCNSRGGFGTGYLLTGAIGDSWTGNNEIEQCESTFDPSSDSRIIAQFSCDGSKMLKLKEENLFNEGNLFRYLGVLGANAILNICDRDCDFEDQEDTDKDCLPDTWETAHSCLEVGKDDSGLDPDNDSRSNRQEYLNNNDPCAYNEYKSDVELMPMSDMICVNQIANPPTFNGEFGGQSSFMSPFIKGIKPLVAHENVDYQSADGTSPDVVVAFQMGYYTKSDGDNPPIKWLPDVFELGRKSNDDFGQIKDQEALIFEQSNDIGQSLYHPLTLYRYWTFYDFDPSQEFRHSQWQGDMPSAFRWTARKFFDSFLGLPILEIWTDSLETMQDRIKKILNNELKLTFDQSAKFLPAEEQASGAVRIWDQISSSAENTTWLWKNVIYRLLSAKDRCDLYLPGISDFESLDSNELSALLETWLQDKNSLGNREALTCIQKVWQTEGMYLNVTGYQGYAGGYENYYTRKKANLEFINNYVFKELEKIVGTDLVYKSGCFANFEYDSLQKCVSRQSTDILENPDTFSNFLSDLRRRQLLVTAPEKDSTSWSNGQILFYHAVPFLPALTHWEYLLRNGISELDFQSRLIKELRKRNANDPDFPGNDDSFFDSGFGRIWLDKVSSITKKARAQLLEMATKWRDNSLNDRYKTTILSALQDSNYNQNLYQYWHCLLNEEREDSEIVFDSTSGCLSMLPDDWFSKYYLNPDSKDWLAQVDLFNGIKQLDQKLLGNKNYGGIAKQNYEAAFIIADGKSDELFLNLQNAIANPLDLMDILNVEPDQDRQYPGFEGGERAFESAGSEEKGMNILKWLTEAIKSLLNIGKGSEASCQDCDKEFSADDIIAQDQEFNPPLNQEEVTSSGSSALPFADRDKDNMPDNWERRYWKNLAPTQEQKAEISSKLSIKEDEVTCQHLISLNKILEDASFSARCSETYSNGETWTCDQFNNTDKKWPKPNTFDAESKKITFNGGTDNDNDKRTDFQEFCEKTDPLVPDLDGESVLAMVSLELSANPNFIVYNKDNVQTSELTARLISDSEEPARDQTIVFEIIGESKGRASLSETEELSELAVSSSHGIAIATLYPQSKHFGVAQVMAHTVSKGNLSPISSNPIEVQSGNKIARDGLNEVRPVPLYVSLLGGAFGDFREENYLGGVWLFAGRTQAVTTMTIRGDKDSPSNKDDTLDEADALDNFKIGFSETNQNFVMNIASGMPVGLAGVKFANTAEILLGDPTVKLSENAMPEIIAPDNLLTGESAVWSKSGYTKDIGEMIDGGFQNIQKLLHFDVNNDGREDIVALADNKLSWYENVIGYPRFRKRGPLLSFNDLAIK
ncbi:MAG: hypothetical protein NTZ80_02545, partial [Patescibacteria group bacterium]|nr:hypothetical protein [Patescibacteria group bacterium]